MTPTFIKKRSLELLNARLTEYEEGTLPFDPQEILKIHQAFNEETPSAYFILTTLHNEMEFLPDYAKQEGLDKEGVTAIERFLLKFQQRVVTEFLATASTLPDGLFLMLDRPIEED